MVVCDGGRAGWMCLVGSDGRGEAEHWGVCPRALRIAAYGLPGSDGSGSASTSTSTSRGRKAGRGGEQAGAGRSWSALLFSTYMVYKIYRISEHRHRHRHRNRHMRHEKKENLPIPSRPYMPTKVLFPNTYNTNE